MHYMPILLYHIWPGVLSTPKDELKFHGDKIYNRFFSGIGGEVSQV